MRIFKSLLKNSEETDSSILPLKDSIVLVEPDDQDALRVIEILSQAGFDVIHVKSCTQTFEYLQSSNDQVVAIITDFTLAVGNAIDIAHYARSISPDIIIIAVGHDIDETLLIKAMQAGVSYCITKVEDFATQLPNLIKLSKEQQQGFKTTAVSETPAKTFAKTLAKNSSEQPTVEYKGQLGSTTIPRLLRTFYQQQSTGALHITHDGEVTSLFFIDGAIAFSRVPAAEQRLGEAMVKSGRITFSQLASAMRLVRESNMRLGRALNSLGIIQAEEMKPLIVQHILKLFYNTFDWESGEFVFEHGTKPDREMMLSLSTADVIFAGIRHLKNRALIDRWLGDCDRILIPTSDPFALFQALTLRPEEAAVLEKIDRPMSVNQIRAIADLDEEVVSHTLCGFIETGMFIPFEAKAERLFVEMPKFSEIFDTAPLPPDFDARAAAEFCYEVETTLQNFRTGDHYLVLNAAPDASINEITDAYRSLAKQFHPDRHSQLASYNLNLKSDLKTIFEKLAEAYYTLSDPGRRESYDKLIRPKGATRRMSASDLQNVVTPIRQSTMPLPNHIPGMPGSEEYEVALDHYGRREFDKARRALVMAIEENPLNPEYRVAIARSMIKIPAYTRQAEEAYLKAIELAPQNGDYYAELGLLYQQFSQVAQAKEMMQRALELDPHNPIALRVKL